MRSSTKRIPVIGIVGGIGAGKSTVARAFGELGCRVLDADAIGHSLLTEPQVVAEVRRRWGECVLDPAGRVDRKALGAIVFADAAELSALNALLHPRIGRRLADQIAAARCEGDCPAIIVDAAVLFEAGWDALCDHVVFVSSDAEQRRQRVISTRGWDDQTWARREKSQISLAGKRAKCDYSVENSSSVSRLHDRIREVFQAITAEADPEPD